jgi:predicted acylesterase/phospholipase RssA
MTGLVLAGGGAKGAYQIGAWKALRERGIEFDVISGTSIGALNAALVASGDLDKAQTFWRALSTARLARTNPLLLPGLLLRLLSIPIPGANFGRTHSARELRIAIKCVTIVIISFAVLVVALMFSLSMPSSIVLPLGFLIMGLGLLLLLPYVAELINGALVSRGVLSGLVDESVDWTNIAAGRPTVFVTVARSVRDRNYRKLTVTAPHYATLGDFEASEAHACLTASMALPFGIFPHIEICDGRYMDGGVADNIPIYPLLAEECRVIYVVHLSPKPRYRNLDLLDDEQLEAAMRRIDSVRRKAGLPGLYGRKWDAHLFKTAHAMKARFISQSKISNYIKEFSKRPGGGTVKIVHIVPQRPLGWSLLGTLIFSRAKTERLLAQGYEDAKATLSGLRPLPAPRPGWQERQRRRDFWVVHLMYMSILLVMLGLILLARYLKSG